jgi:Trypsin-like peptidase domain
MRRVAFTLLGFLLSVFLLSVNFAKAQGTALDLERIERATVYVMQARNVGDDLFVTCVGSGTIVSRNGLILTNAHNTLASDNCPGETLVVALSLNLNEPPVAEYRAEIAQADAGLDLALLRITHQLDGRLVDPATLALPFVELADVNSTKLDETITVVGYPGIQNDPVSVVRGTVIGFVREPRSDPAWVKTRAEIPGTMSGGGAYDSDGKLMGVPTTAPVARQAASGNCLPIQDTNRDGLVNGNDGCIALGDFINSLRPISLARLLLRGGSLGLSIENLSVSSGHAGSSGSPTFKRLFFSPSVNEAGVPTSVVRSLPAGSSSLFLFFDYANMSPETVYELRVTRDGILDPTFSLAPVRWSGGESGLWYIGSSGQPWPIGTYEFTLLANGVTSPNSTIRLLIGGAPSNSPSFSDLTFGLLDPLGKPIGNGYVLPSGSPTASAQFIFHNLQKGTNWTAIWYLNGNELTQARTSDVWKEGTNGVTTTSIDSKDGLPPGTYRLELYIENGLAATSDFTIAGAQQGALPQIFTNLHFTTANTANDALTAIPISTFPSTVNTLYLLFDWQQMAPGTLWKMTWSVDGDVFYEQIVPWSASESGQNYFFRFQNPAGIPDGTYSVELSINNIVLAKTEAQVGIGQLPIDRFAQASGVQMRGQILDADTHQGLPGVTFILISAEFSVSEFTWDQNQVYAMAVTDQNGFFEIDRPLELSTKDKPVAYSAIIAADGYLPISADGITVDDKTENPLNMVIYLTHD